jgi:hypothetical protein
MMRGSQFKPGYDPRRRICGRPLKGETPSDIFRKIGAEKLPDDVRAALTKRFPQMKPRERFMDALCRAVFSAALRGESWAVEQVFNRCYGKVKDQLELSAGAPMVVFPKDVSYAPGIDGKAGVRLAADTGRSDEAPDPV